MRRFSIALVGVAALVLLTSGQVTAQRGGHGYGRHDGHGRYHFQRHHDRVPRRPHVRAPHGGGFTRWHHHRIVRPRFGYFHHPRYVYSPRYLDRRSYCR